MLARSDCSNSLTSSHNITLLYDVVRRGKREFLFTINSPDYCVMCALEPLATHRLILQASITHMLTVNEWIIQLSTHQPA